MLQSPLMVSILARHKCRAQPVDRLGLVVVIWFQSSPGTSAGRNLLSMVLMAISMCFNPRPARVPGATGFRISFDCWLLCFNPRPARVPGATMGNRGSWRNIAVSILARHECRAQPWTPVRDAEHVQFQSSPGTSAGRNSPRRRAGYGTGVSILARHECRAQRRHERHVQTARRVSILARHECRAQRPGSLN